VPGGSTGWAAGSGDETGQRLAGVASWCGAVAAFPVTPADAARVTLLTGAGGKLPDSPHVVAGDPRPPPWAGSGNRRPAVFP